MRFFRSLLRPLILQHLRTQLRLGSSVLDADDLVACICCTNGWLKTIWGCNLHAQPSFKLCPESRQVGEIQEDENVCAKEKHVNMLQHLFERGCILRTPAVLGL